MFDKRNIHYLLFKDFRESEASCLAVIVGVLIFLFLYLSFCFGLLQVLNDDYETEFSIPLRLKCT